MTRTVSLTLLFAALPLTAADWPQWRGPDRTGISKETGLLKEWPADGPKIRWKLTDIGTGYSSPSVVGGKVFLQTTAEKEEFAMCLDEKTGEKKWKTKIGNVGLNKGPQYPGTRATPTVDGDRIYCLASDGTIACLDLAGEVKWTKNIAKEFSGAVGAWAYTESLLIDGDALICTPGGKEATLAALKKTNGDVIWKCAVPEGDIADYASIMVLEAGGTKQYVTYMRKGVVAADAKTGKFLWRYTGTVDFGANMLTPVIFESKVYVSSRSGGDLVQVKADGGAMKAEQVYKVSQLNGGIGGAVLVDGHLYGATGASLFCANFKTGAIEWTEKLGNCSVCYAEGCVYARIHNSGEIVLVDADEKKYVEKGRAKQPDRTKTPAWPHPVIANGGLYVRDMGTLVCYDIAAKQ